MAILAKANQPIDENPKTTKEPSTPIISDDEFHKAAMNHLQAVLMHTPSDAGFIELRALPRKEGDKPDTYWLSTDSGTKQIEGAVEWATNYNKGGYDLYLGYNARKMQGDGTKANVPVVTASYIDLDLDKFGINRETAIKTIRRAPIQPNLVIDSGHGLHLIHFHEATEDKRGWSILQDRLTEFYAEVGADKQFKPHEAAILRLTPFINQKDSANPVPTSIVRFRPEETPRPFSEYVVEFKAERRTEEREPGTELVAGDGVSRMAEVVDSNRNVTLTKEAGRLRKYGYNEEEILACLRALNEGRCNPPLPDFEVVHIASSVCRYRPDEDIIIIDDETERSLDMNIGTFCRTAFPNVDPIIYGLRPAQIGMVQAVPNVGKSTMMLNLAMSVSCGRDYEPLYDGGVPRKVLYLDHENTASFLQADIIRMKQNFDDEEQILIDENMRVIVDKFIEEDPLDLSVEAHFEAVLRRAVDMGAEIIIIDTLAEAFSMHNENDNSEMKRVVITPLKKLAKMSNACVLIVHHIGKLSEGRGNVGLYRSRGASSLPGAVRLVLDLDHLKDGDGVVVKDHITVRVEKVKGPKFDDQIFRLNFGDRWFEATEMNLPTKDSRTEQVIRLVDARLKLSEILSRVEEAAIDSSRSTVIRNLKFAVSTGMLRKVQGSYEPTSMWEKRFGSGESSPEVIAEGGSDPVEFAGTTDADLVGMVQDVLEDAGANVIDINTRKVASKKSASKKKVGSKKKLATKKASKKKVIKIAAAPKRRKYEEV